MPLIRTSFLKTLIFQSSRLNYSTVIPPPSSSSSSSSSDTSKNAHGKGSATKPIGLSNILKQMIKSNGPIPLSHYMSQCLSDPEYGYYTTRDPLDSSNKDNIESDFVTSPEISSTFGEICGVWYFSMFLAQLKQISMQEKSKTVGDKFNVHEKIIRIVEFGPGRGTLMFDMLRVLNKFIDTKNEIEVVMVEVSDILRDEQKSLLCQINNDPDPEQQDLTIWNNKIQWLNNEKDLEELISKESSGKYINFVMAHEFFDALPINRFCKTSKGWREYLVDSYDHQTQKTELPNVTLYKPESSPVKEYKPEFSLVLSPYITPYCSFLNVLPRYKDLPLNSNVEVSFKTYDYISVISKLITNNLENGYQLGSGLIIDYGPSDTIPTSTLRGISKHKLVDPFIKPGEIDLSSDVDFVNIQNLFSEYFKCNSFITEQGDWLNSMGLNFRIEQILESEYDKTEDKENFEKRKSDVLKSYERLTGKGIRDMGSVYKVMAVIPNNSNILPVGFGGDI